MRPNKQPLDMRCRIEEPRLPLVWKLAGVHKQLCVAEAVGTTPRKETIGDDVANQENENSDSDPALHRTERERDQPPLAKASLI